MLRALVSINPPNLIECLKEMEKCGADLSFNAEENFEIVDDEFEQDLHEEFLLGDGGYY